MKICEIQLQLNENGELYIPSSLLRDMGLSPADPVYLAYLSNDGVENEYREFLLSPEAIGIMAQHQQLLSWAELFDSASIDEKKVIASQLIKAVTLTRNYGIQIEFSISEAQFLNGMEMG